MIIIDVIKIAALIICCIMATKTDLLEGTISNKLIVAFAVIGVLLDAVSISLSSISETKLFLFNAGSLIVIAFLLYFLKIWAGGDCKLLAVVAILYPSTYYWRLDSTPLTLWYSLGFMFGTGFVYLLVESTVLSIKDKRKILTRDSFKTLGLLIIQYLKALVFMSALSHIYLLLVYPHFRIPTLIYTIVCIVYIWALHTYNIFQSKIIIGCFLIFDVMMTLLTGNITVSTMWITYAIVILFMIIRLFINHYNYKNINTIDITKGMILSRMSSLLMQNSRVKGLPGISDESLGSRLSEEEAASIIRWSKTKSGYEQVMIVRKMPFAVFITSGILLYTAFRGILQ